MGIDRHRPLLGRRAALAGMLLMPAQLAANGISVVTPIADALRAQRAGRIPMAMARDVRRGWGVCGRPGEDGSVDEYAAMLGFAGTRDLRVAFVQGGRSAAPRLEALRRAMAARGIAEPVPRVTTLVTAYMNDLGTDWPLQQRAILEFAGSGMLRAIEGPNEIDNWLAGLGAHGPDDRVPHAGPDAVSANFQAWSAALGRFRQSHAGLRDVTLVAPSLIVGPPAAEQRLPDVSAYVDAANLHFYAGHGRQPSYSMRFDPYVGTFHNMLHWARQAQRPGGPIWLTECGASTSGDYARDGASQAAYLANQLLDLFAAGGEHLFFYQLVDGSSRPGDVEGNFGLFRHDRTPKPAATMLALLADLLSVGIGYDDPRNAVDHAPFVPAFDVRRLAVPRLAEAGRDDPNSLVLPKSDGRTLIALWNEPPIDDGRGHDIASAPHALTIDLGIPARYALHDLLALDGRDGIRARRASPSHGRFVDMTLKGHPLLIEILADHS